MRHLIIALIIALPCAAHADSWVSPQVVELSAPGGAWRVTVTPDDDPSDPDTRASATLSGPEGEVRFDLLAPWMPVDLMLTDDGRLLTLDDWHQLGYGDAVAVLYSPAGEVLWERSLVELIGEEGRDEAPHSVSSIWWRKKPLEAELDPDGAHVTLTLWDEDRLRIDLSDGSTELRVVEDVGDDPERLVTRAHALARIGEFNEAAERYRRTLDLKPDHLEALRGLALALLRLEEHAEVIELLTTSAAAQAATSYAAANLHRQLAEAYLALGQAAEAEAAWEAAWRAEPTYSTPVLELARHLHKAGRHDAIDDLMRRVYEANSEAGHARLRVAGDIAGFYRDHGRLEEAAAWYERIYSAESVTHQHAYLGLADTYEALGRAEDAIAIHRQLIDYWESSDADVWGSYIKQSREAIERLEEPSP